MKTLKLGVILLALLLAAMALVPCASAGNTGLVNAQSDMVSKDQAQNVALLNIHDIAHSEENFSDWMDSTVWFSNTYYDLSGSPTAYAFDIKHDGKYDGYILISATVNNYPVLECSKGVIPTLSPEAATESLSVVSQRTKTEGLTSADPKPVYLGATFFLMEYPLENKTGTVVDHVFVDLTDKKVINVSDTGMGIPLTKDSLLKNQQSKKEEIAKLWNEQSPSSQSRVSPLLRSSNYIYDVPFYQWYLGCSPTAAGMVLGYWSSHGYSNLPTGTTVINELASAMGTGSTWPLNGVTWPIFIDDGIETVARNHGYTSFDGVENIWLYGDHFEEMASEVDAQRPFVLSMAAGGMAVGKPTAYGYHSVTGVGYVRGVQNYITIHDTWNNPPNYPLSSDRLIANGNWAAAMTDWVRH
ncbi:MAG: C39 family peptidase [Methanoregula sp.]|jgi:hypothetical protein|uniref:C39 family peptidase n=1 Tax=Methanoregula sp. TaxID=2052170 RepID=UPI003D149511